MPALSRNRGHRLAAYAQCSVDPPAVGHTAVVPRRPGAGPFPTRVISMQSDLRRGSARHSSRSWSVVLTRSARPCPRVTLQGFAAHARPAPKIRPRRRPRGDSRSRCLGRCCDGAASTRSRSVTSLTIALSSRRSRVADEGDLAGYGITSVDGGPPNKRMKLTRLSAAPGRQAFDAVAEGAASCPRRRETAGTASQLMRSVRRTSCRDAYPGHVRARATPRSRQW